MSDTPLSPPRLAWDWAGGWAFVFGGNLVLPLILAHINVSRSGWFGAVGGLAVLYWIGFVLCLYRFRVSRSLVVGGVIVALSQAFSVLHIFSGAFAMSAWDAVGGSRLGPQEEFSPTRLDALGAFFVALLTAQPLMVLAVLFGAAIRWSYGDTPIWFARRTDPDAEPVVG